MQKQKENLKYLVADKREGNSEKTLIDILSEDYKSWLFAAAH